MEDFELFIWPSMYTNSKTEVWKYLNIYCFKKGKLGVDLKANYESPEEKRMAVVLSRGCELECELEGSEDTYGDLPGIPIFVDSWCDKTTFPSKWISLYYVAT